jgi:hypothetical protein
MIASSLANNAGSFAVNPSWTKFIVVNNSGLKMSRLQV